MDIIFQFVQPFVEFFSAHYATGCYILVFLVITGIVVSIHLDKDSEGRHTTSVEDVCVISLISVIFILIWPVVVSLALIFGICYSYYLLIGILIKRLK